MSLELDWLEREERYRRRVTRLLTVFVILVGALVGTGAYLRSKHAKEAREAAARAAEQQRLDAERRQREQFTADSTAVANRWASFMQTHQAKAIEGLPFIEIPLPPGQAARPFVERLWTDYVRVIDPAATSSQEITWYRQHFIGVLNDGPLRGRAVLLPILDQSGTKLEIRKASFTQITKAQVEVGMREPPPEEAPVDSLGLSRAAPTGGETAPPATEPSAAPPAASPSSETPPTAGGQPAGDSPAATAPAEPAPTPTPPAPSEPAPSAAAPSEPAPVPAPTEPVPSEPAPAPSAPANTPAIAPSPAPTDTVPKP